MKDKKTPKNTAEFYSVKNKLSNKNKLPKEISLYGMTQDQYNEGVKIHFKCFSQIMKVI
ncbi:hypothetical protein ACFSJW_18805 [Flavobacterium artemisiae]|uniref:Uncharacterized protein n=1 Tax=Flavobacterium artemisiae TaxID=2126556 RepID=A0ABW4HAN0_9FLAO